MKLVDAFVQIDMSPSVALSPRISALRVVLSALYPMRTVSMGKLYDKGTLMENNIVRSF